MSVFSFKTIQSSATGLYKEKCSKFLSFAFPVRSDQEIKACLEKLRKEYFDAGHHCYAFRLGPDGTHFRASDDGEPNHSAGDPILGQIKSRELTNVLVVVVRYFGGIKLGVGGLVSAYKQAAEEALKACVIIEQEVRQTITLTYDYAYTPEVMRLIKDFGLKILQQEFDETYKLVVEIRLLDEEKIKEKLALLNATGSRIVVEDH